jgi:hypothetical protein
LTSGIVIGVVVNNFDAKAGGHYLKHPLWPPSGRLGKQKDEAADWQNRGVLKT